MDPSKRPLVSKKSEHTLEVLVCTKGSTMPPKRQRSESNASPSSAASKRRSVGGELFLADLDDIMTLYPSTMVSMGSLRLRNGSQIY
jgi:hypothetical protein